MSTESTPTPPLTPGQPASVLEHGTQVDSLLEKVLGVSENAPQSGTNGSPNAEVPKTKESAQESIADKPATVGTPKEETSKPQEQSPQSDKPAVEEPKKEDKPELELPLDIDEPTKQDDGTVTNAEENFKNLRNVVKETKAELETRQKELEEARLKLQEYETGAVMPEVLQTLQNRVGELEAYETLHNLKASKPFKEKFVKPMSALRSNLEKIGADYGIPKEVIGKALNIRKEADLNKFLADHFDPVGAMEVKQTIGQLHNLSRQAREAEMKPMEVMAELEEESRRIEHQQEHERYEKINNSSRAGWVKALTDIKKEGKVTELIKRDNDSEFNRNFFTPIVTKAADEYRKFVKGFADLGLKQLPEELSTGLSKMCLLAIASGVAIQAREAAIKHADELETNTSRTRGLVRPALGGSANGSSGTSPAAKSPNSPEEAAAMVLKSIGL